MSQSLPAADPKSLSELYWTCTRIHLYSNLLSKESPPQVANRAQILHVLACFAEDEHSKMTPTFLHAACAPTAERIVGAESCHDLTCNVVAGSSSQKIFSTTSNSRYSKQRDARCPRPYHINRQYASSCSRGSLFRMVRILRPRCQFWIRCV